MSLARLGLQVTVIGQRSRSNGEKLCFDVTFYTMHVLRSGRYMGSACRVVRKITMTHGIQSKISVCLSVIRKRLQSRAARSGRGLLIDRHDEQLKIWYDFYMSA